MRKTIMFTICITVLSFGMIDSATTSEINYDKLMEDDKLRKEAEHSKSNNITKMNLIDS